MTFSSKQVDGEKRTQPCERVLMLVENTGYPEDTRIAMESRSLRDAGYEVTVICPTGLSRRWHEVVDGVRVYRYPKTWEVGGFIGYVCEYSYSLSMAFVLSLWVAVRHGFDVLHSRVPPDVYVFLAWFYKLFGKRYVADLQDSSPDIYQAQRGWQGNRLVHATLCWLERAACRSADGLITINDTYQQMLLERSGVQAERCCIVRNVPNPRFFDAIEPLSSLRALQRPIVGYMGMIGVQDHVELLLHTLHSLRTEYKQESFLAVIVGSGSEFNLLKRLATQLHLEEHVRFTGYLSGDDLVRQVASFDIGVTPDPSNPYNDTCSFLKTMEYMAMGKPVVTFDMPESRILAGDAALYAKNNSVHELAGLIARLIDDPKEAALLGERGRRRARMLLRWEQQEKVLLGLYDRLLDCCGESSSPDSSLNVATLLQQPVAVESASEIASVNS